MKKEEKDYIEVEVIKNEKEKNFSQKAFNYGANFGQEKFKENINDFKKGLYWKVFLAFLPQLLGIILFFLLVFGLIFLIFDHPFDYILAGLFLYFLIKQILNLRRFFK